MRRSITASYSPGCFAWWARPASSSSFSVITHGSFGAGPSMKITFLRRGMLARCSANFRNCSAFSTNANWQSASCTM